MSMELKATDLQGMYPAITTPFTANGKIDDKALVELIEHLIDSGIQGIVPVGGTGEYTALSPEERTHVVALTVKTVAGRVPVVPGVLSPGYAEALDHGKKFLDAGADGLLLVAPFYVHPSPQGLHDYFVNYVNEIGNRPVLLYDIPGRTSVAVSVESIARLAEAKLIIGIKACNTNLMHFERIVQLTGNDIGILSGDDFLYPAHAALGAHGGILASSTLLPGVWAQMDQQLRHGSLQEGLKIHRTLTPLFDALFSESNPGPLKTALQLVGHSNGAVRLPLVAPGQALRDRLKAELIKVRSLSPDDIPATVS